MTANRIQAKIESLTCLEATKETRNKNWQEAQTNFKYTLAIINQTNSECISDIKAIFAISSATNESPSTTKLTYVR